MPAQARDGVVSRFALAFVFTILFYSTTHVREFLRGYAWEHNGSEAVAEIHRVEAQYPSMRVQVGVGDRGDDPLVSYGIVSAFDGQPYMMNFTSVRDLQLGGVEVSGQTTDYLRACQTQVWLIPKGQAPFAATNLYFDPGRLAFSQELRNTFLKQYRAVQSMHQFDVWLCGPGT